MEKLATMRFPEAMVFTGGALGLSPMVVYAYQLVMGDGGQVIVDTGMTETGATQMRASDFDAAASERVQKALHPAKGIYVTHEHADHLGGLLVEIGKLADLAPVHVTRAQLDNIAAAAPYTLAADIAAKIVPLAYDGMLEVAPGVVLVKAAGHTPGSQLVYVQLADGRELLLLGDTAWHTENVSEERVPPLLTHLMLHDDRDATACQLIALHALQRGAPAIEQVPGHDPRVVDSLLERGLLVRGFR